MKSKAPVLYMERGCPFGMRAKLAFLTSQVKCKFCDVDPESVEQKTNMAQSGYFQNKPTWVELSNGLVINDSYDIMKFALGVSDPDMWLKCKDVDSWLANVDKLFMNAYKLYLHPEVYKNGSWKKEVGFFLSYLETELYKNKGFLDECQHWTIKDALALPMVYKLSTIDEKWWVELPFPKVHIWLDKFKSSRLFQLMMDQKKQ